jgi:hypothetical protein
MIRSAKQQWQAAGLKPRQYSLKDLHRVVG